MTNPTEQERTKEEAEQAPLLQLGRAVLASQPFSVHLGAELAALEPGRAELAITMARELEQQNGFAHGGVISYLVDNALTFVGGSVLGPNVLTQEYKISYLRPAKGERLSAQASVVSHSKRQAVCRCDIYVQAGDSQSLCATALGTILTVDRPRDDSQHPS
jgi:uncharacterized protein (TIGR00369 family)